MSHKKQNNERNIFMKKTAALFLTFFKIGAFTFGGGYAMIALLQNEFVDKKKWITKEDFFNMAAIAESTPGPVAINSATYIGYRVDGFRGAAASTLAVCIPSFVIIYLISLYFDTFLSFRYVNYAFEGIRVCVIYLILSAGLQMLKELPRNSFNMILFTASAGFMIMFSLLSVSFSSVFYIMICGAIGISVNLLQKISRKGECR